jgi:hypothetical protein
MSGRISTQGTIPGHTFSIGAKSKHNTPAPHFHNVIHTNSTTMTERRIYSTDQVLPPRTLHAAICLLLIALNFTQRRLHAPMQRDFMLLQQELFLQFSFQNAPPPIFTMAVMAIIRFTKDQIYQRNQYHSSTTHCALSQPNTDPFLLCNKRISHQFSHADLREAPESLQAQTNPVLPLGLGKMVLLQL